MTQSQRKAAEPADLFTRQPLLLARSFGRLVLDQLPRAIPVLIWLAVGLAGGYCISIVYGAAMGHALPTAAIFWIPVSSLIVRLEESLPRVVLVVAFAGTLFGWLAKAGAVDEAQVHRNEISGTRLLRRYGLLIYIAVFLLGLTCSSGWSGSGRLVPNDGGWDSLVGLVPLSDSHAYYVSPVEELLTGHWNAFASRRPFAAGFRQLLLTAGGFSYLQTLLLQAILIGAAVFLAVRSVILWRGLWSGIAFGALTYLVARPFLSTMLTEPLGLFWALLAVTFTAEALRLQSLPHAWLALVALAFAEVIRMGSIFTIPAFVLWIAIAFGASLRNRLKLAAVGGALIGLVLIIQRTIEAMYGSPDGTTAANFGFTLCGLALGHDWGTCSRLFASELQQIPAEGQQAAFLTAKAFELIRQSPYPMLGRMLANIHELVIRTPEFFLYGIQTYHRPLQEVIFVGALVPGLWLAWRSRDRGEASFWALLFISLVGSAALILADDGWRTMHATWPFVALFFSMGFLSPMATRPANPGKPMISSRAGVSLIVALVALTAVAPDAGRIWAGAELMSLPGVLRAQAGQTAILAGATVTGFLVIPDDANLPPRVPAIRRSDFIRLVKDLELEKNYGRFLDFATMRSPFAVITAARVDGRADWPEYFFVGPAEILIHGSAPAWKVEIGARTRDSLGNDLVLNLTSVEPLGVVQHAAPGSHIND